MDNKNKKFPFKIFLVVGTIALGIFVYFNRSTLGNNSSFNISTYLPIYIAIFIPFILDLKKKQEAGEDIDKRKVLIIFFVVAILVSIGILISKTIS